MITYETAREVAVDYVKRMNDVPDYDPVYLAYLRRTSNDPTYSQAKVNLVLTGSREESFGWLFFYNSKEFLETQNFSLAVAGNAPVIIDRITGKLTVTGTAHPVEYYIEQYKNNRESYRN